ncbi:MAG: hypothetical protein PHP08_00595 [Candidatus Dojkabacteria bacterium]|nr:hypothetical protein [Candidatus Dojkabacteria bacterium]
MGKKIDSIKEMYELGLPAPRCVFIMKEDDVDLKLTEFLTKYPSEFYTIRTDTEDNSMSCKRLLSATRTELVYLSSEWKDMGFQIILQEFIDEKNEIKSGNIYLKNDKVIIEGAKAPHHIFTNGRALDIHLKCDRFNSSYYDLEYNRFYNIKDTFSISEIIRLLKLARRVPYYKAIIEFSFFKNGSCYFWEIKKENTLRIMDQFQY